MDYPRVLYKPGSKLTLDGVGYDTLIVDDAEAGVEARKAGWSEYDDMGKAAPKGPLDGSVKELIEYLVDETDPAVIRKLIADEKAGKTRAGAIAALEARLGELG